MENQENRKSEDMTSEDRADFQNFRGANISFKISPALRDDFKILRRQLRIKTGLGLSCGDVLNILIRKYRKITPLPELIKKG